MGLISDFLSGENRRREEAAKRAVGIDEDYERRMFLATHPNMESEDETDDDYEEEDDEDDFIDEFDDENDDDEEDDDNENKMSATKIICGAIIGAKLLRRGEELGLVNLDDL